jgi:glycogen synthase
LKLLISSHFFAPSVGGIEQVSGILAEEFAALGHEVRVITQTPAENEPAGQRFSVIRQPSRGAVFGLLRWCDAYLQSNISVSTLWPALLLRKPTLVTYHTWVSRVDGGIGWQDRLKRLLAKCVSRNLAVSRPLAESISTKCGVVPNPYQDDLFVEDGSIKRDRELVFLGRLVSDKGADILVEALSVLKGRGLTPNLSIIGTGPEEAALKQHSGKLGLDGQITFLGKRTGTDLVRELNRHQIMVVPSRWSEPFGLVALEAIACGLVAVGSSRGGLADAIGPCGVIFPTGDATALADALEKLLRSPETWATYRQPASAHLARHTRRAVALEYLRHLEEIRA